MAKVVHLRDHRSTLREELGLPTRIANVLGGAGIFTLEDLLGRSWADIDNIRGIGSDARRDIRGTLAFQRLWLPDHPDRPLRERHSATKDERALPFEALGLAARTVSTLRAGGITTVGDLVDMNRADLVRIPGVGDGTVREVKARLKEQGLALTRYYGFVSPDPPTPGDPTATVEALYYDGRLSVRAFTMLRRAKIATVANLVAMTPDEVRALPGIGSITFDLVRHSLHALGFRLRGERRPRGAPRSE